MDLTEDEVLKILNLLDNSNFDFMEVELGDLKLTVSKSGYVPGSSDPAAVPTRETASSAAPDPAPPSTAPAAPPEQAPPVAAEGHAGGEGLVAVPSPMVGTFYAAPEPGAPPFVENGTRVEEDTTVGLIETMKVFTAIQAGVRGVIGEVLVSNAEFVEYGQDLFLVRPDASLEGER